MKTTETKKYIITELEEKEEVTSQLEIELQASEEEMEENEELKAFEALELEVLGITL